MAENYKFDLPTHHKSIIKVIGVGGGGSNAVNYMCALGIKDVEFIICNTDMQALKSSPVPGKLQIGIGLTEGLGAGANPEVGMKAAMESKEEIRELLNDGTKMVFVTAGMGGGTGTGAAPVIAKIARDMDILTVGIVTAPFSFEGRRKVMSATDGINQMKDNCDTVLVISNDKLREIYGNLPIRQAFSNADDVLATAAKSIAEIITVTNDINVDFQDVRTVMKNSGPAVMGSAVVGGENRARRVAEMAISSPLLNNTDIRGAQKILLSISYGEDEELRMDELSEITDYIQEMAGYDADLIFGEGPDVTLGDKIRVTVIATGFADRDTEYKQGERKVYDLESNKEIQDSEPQVTKQEYKPQVRPVVTNHMDRKNDKPTPQAETPKPVAKVEKTEEEKVYYKLEDDDFKIIDKSDYKDNEIEANLEAKKRKLMEQSQERIRRLQELSNRSEDEMKDFREKLDVPAYLRRNVKLDDVPHSSENNMSRYNLNDEDGLLGNNRFLHDNVD